MGVNEREPFNQLRLSKKEGTAQFGPLKHASCAYIVFHPAKLMRFCNFGMYLYTYRLV